MPKPVCHDCKRFYRCVRSGVIVLEQMPSENEAQPGKAESWKWTPYKIWMADLWRCLGCQKEIISGFGQAPVSEHYKPDFAGLLPLVQYTVNDC